MKKAFYRWFFVATLLFATNVSFAQEKTVDTVAKAAVTVVESAKGVNANVAYVTDKIENAITTLSTKLGVAATKIWEILVKQAYITAWTDVLMICMCVIGIFILLLLHLRFSKYDNNDDRPYDEEYILGIMIFASAVVLALLTISLTNLNEIITGFNNPEYLALKEILKAL